MSSQANGADLQRTESYTWPAAHVGHLNETQQSQLDKFRRLCESKGYYTPATDDTPATHDDETLLRYLRARKFNPEQAFDQLKETEDWRKANNLDHLYETIDIDEYEQTRRLYPQWTGRRDKRGIPFYVYEIGQVDAKAVSAYSSDRDNSSSSSSSKSKSTNTTTSPQTPRKMLRLFALYENLCRFVLPLCSLVPDRSHSETPVSQSSNVVDLSNVGITKFWSLRNHMSDASQLATAHYPETLDRIFVVGAPSFFPTVWEYAKRWFDPITVSKIFILSEKNMRSTLEQYVDLDNLPKKYGGNLDWEFGDMPALDPGIVKALDWEEIIEQKGHKTLPIGPIRWEYEDENGKKGDLVAKAIGTEKGKPRRNVIAGLHPEAGLARLALSPGRQSVPGNKSQSISNGGGSRTASATTASVQSSTLAAASSSTRSQDQSTTPTTTSETKGSTEGKKMNAPADYMNPVEGEEGGSQTTNTARTAGEGEGKNTYLDYSGLGAGTAVAAGAGAGVAGAATAAETSNSTNTSTDPNASVPTTTTTSPPAPQQETRQGTSSTRYAQQEGTHAAGQLAAGTPETKIDSQGEKQGIMEPGTVGQAPKKHPLRDELGEEMKGGNDREGGEGKGSGGSSGGMMGQASNYANSAVQSAKSGAGAVMGAVGMGGAGKSKEEEEKRRKEEDEKEKEKERRRDDPEVEKMDGRNVEEFLRSKTASAAEPMKR
ncbi:CRAL/TRIO domain-containing protein [Hortaea werneckii]|nr:CRAL/TRIO domain-containing protein [Hortaea werneckii]